MAFDYGIDTLGIKNPFKTEGVLELSKGLIILILGVVVVFGISNHISTGEKTLAWVKMGVAVFFLSWGIKSILGGSFKVFRFLVGRNVPANLSAEKDDTNKKAKRPYKAIDLAEMLKKRLNPTFKEKDTYISKLIISIIPKFLFLPPGFRNMLEGITAALGYTLITLFIFSLSVFAIKTKLLEVTNDSVLLEWFGLFLSIRLLIVWYRNRPSNHRINTTHYSIYSVKTVIFSIIAAILLPILIEIVLQNGFILPELGIGLLSSLMPIMILGLVTFGLAFYLCKLRADQVVPNTAVSEYKEELQLNMHPRDLFRFFELEMADKRYKELPNRIYRELKPNLILEGSENKGNFSGDTIQETQPIYKPIENPKILKQLRFIIAIFGRIIAITGCLYLYIKVDTFEVDNSFSNIFYTFFYAITLFTFNHYLERIAHVFWAEMLFTSHLVQFFSNGTFSSSKIATGMSVYDSTRSENEIVHTKSTSWIFVGNITTSTIVDSSSQNLEGIRYVLEIHKDDNFLTDVMDGLNNYMGRNELIASMKSDKDVERISKLNKLNEVTNTVNRDFNIDNVSHLPRNKTNNSEGLE